MTTFPNLFCLVFWIMPSLYLCFRFGRTTKSTSVGRGLCSMDIDSNIRKNLNDDNFPMAYELLKRNPMASLSKEDARDFLNNLDNLVSDGKNDNDDQQLKKVEASVLIYNRLSRQQVLKGYGCIDGEYPEKLSEISPIKLEEITGMPMASLTPKERTSYWRLAGISVCLGEYIFGTSIGIDPLFTLIPATFFLFGFDQLVYRGAFFESLYQKLFPEYKRKVICHEAGHFLIAYILGVAVRNCVTNAWEARKYPDIKGQAGTVFYDSKLQDEMSNQKVTRSSLDRLSVVLMAGIAAEAITFGKAEGGAADEQGLISLLSVVQPPWSMTRVQGQARWAAVQAVLLIREHQASYDALVKALEDNLPVGDCILAIEENLPVSLPSAERAAVRQSKRKAVDTDLMMRFVKRMIAQVGGIASAADDDDALQLKARAVTVGRVFEAEAAKAAAAADGAAEEPVPVEPRSIVVRFTETISMLKRAVEEGKVNATDAQSGGGIWLNNLDSFRAPNAPNFDIINRVIIPAEPTTESVQGNDKIVSSSSSSSEITLPPPLEGYEERIRQLQEQEQQQQGTVDAAARDTPTPEEQQQELLLTPAQRRTAAKDLVGFAQRVIADPAYFLAEERSGRTRATLVSLLRRCDKSLLASEIKLELDEIATDPLKWDKFVGDLRGDNKQTVAATTLQSAASPQSPGSNVDSFAVVAKPSQLISPSAVAAAADAVAGESPESTLALPSPEALLESHRGFQLKKLEIEMASNRKKIIQIKQRVEELSKETIGPVIKTTPKTSSTTTTSV